MLRLLTMWLPQPAVITAGGDLRRQPGQDRIAFLAAVRNAALAPLWQVTGFDAGVARPALPGVPFEPCNVATSQDKPWPADRVGFYE